MSRMSWNEVEASWTSKTLCHALRSNDDLYLFACPWGTWNAMQLQQTVFIPNVKHEFEHYLCVSEEHDTFEMICEKMGIPISKSARQIELCVHCSSGHSFHRIINLSFAVYTTSLWANMNLEAVWIFHDFSICKCHTD